MALLTTKQAAVILGTRADSITKFIRRGKITATMIGRDWMIEESEVLRYRDERRLTGENYRLPTHKLCKGCGQKLPLDAFYKNLAAAKTGNRIGVQARCKKCSLDAIHATMAKKPEQYKRHRHEMYMKRWHHERTLAKQWRKDNRGKYLGHMRGYQARKRGATTEIVDYDIIRERDNNICYLCKLPIALEEKPHFDHVIPISKGGAHSYDNVRITHQRCNLRKSDKLITSLVD